MEGDCVFCRIAAGEIPAKIIHENERLVAFLDQNPQAPFHALIIPRKHISMLADATPEDIGLLGEIVFSAQRIAREHKLDDGFRLVNNCGQDGGQTVFHLHFHLLGKRRMKWPPG